MLFHSAVSAKRHNNWLPSQAYATTHIKEMEENGEFTNQVPDINYLSEVTGILELSGLVPTCDAEVLSVHTLLFSEKKNTEREKEVEMKDSCDQIFEFLFCPRPK